MLVFKQAPAKPNPVMPVAADKEPCRCFSCSHGRVREPSPRRAALTSWRRLAETLRYGANR